MSGMRSDTTVLYFKVVYSLNVQRWILSRFNIKRGKIKRMEVCKIYGYISLLIAIVILYYRGHVINMVIIILGHGVKFIYAQ